MTTKPRPAPAGRVPDATRPDRRSSYGRMPDAVAQRLPGAPLLGWT
jgi:hypothetical protein